MREIIKIHNEIQIGSEVVSTVNARDLHKALESKQDFSTWLKARLEKLKLEEGVDYIMIESVGSVSTPQTYGFEDLEQNGTKSYNINNLVKKVKDYYITIDVAKHIAMMEATEKGREVRKYFIECEKKAIEASKKTEFEIPKNYAEALMEAGRLAALNCQLQEELNALHHSGKLYTATEIAKELNFKTTKEFNQSLHDKGIQYKVNGTWVLYSKYSDKGYVEVKQEILENGVVIYHRKFTQAGREFILSLYGVIDKENALTNNTCYDGLAKARELLELN